MALLEQYQDVFVVVHVIAMSIAIGAAAVHDIAFYQQIKFFDSEKWNNRVFEISKTLIFSAFFWVIISGVGLFWPIKEAMLASPKFKLKMIISIVVLVNSILLYQFVLTRVANGLKYSQNSRLKSRPARKLAFIMSGISLSSWFSIAALSSIRNLNIEFNIMLLFYIGLIFTSLILGLYSEHKFSKRFELRSVETLHEIAANLLKDISKRFSSFQQN